MASIVTWKSTDGGKTWAAFRGAPGGDDYQNIWINPNNPDIMLLAADQGAVVTVNGGQTWSSWYNQPTAQLYHVAADNAFPYRVCSGQQESGSACVASRGNDGQITFREWHPVGVDEYGYAAPDPLDPDIVYGGRSVTRYDRRTGQVSNVGPVGPTRGARARGHVPHGAHAAGGVLAGRSARALLREQRPVEDHGRRHALEADQPRPDAQDVGRCRRASASTATTEPRSRSQRGVIYTVGAVLPGHQPHLGRHRRRADPRRRPTAGCTGRT